MLKVRPFTNKDLEEVVQIENAAFSVPWTGQSFESLSQQSGFWVRVGIEDSKVIGYYVAQVVGDEAELHNIAVHPQLQKKGFGKKLLNHFVEESKNAGVQHLFLLVRPSNQAAIHLYQSFQFTLLERRPRYYEESQEDALIFYRTL